MSDTVACVKPNPYLFNIETKKRKPRLAHEAGAGAKCNKCGDRCPGFELHFWRKVCLNCRCSKDDHEIEDDDEDIGKIVIGKLFERPIRTKAEEAEYCHGTDLEIPNNETGKSEKITFEWVPPDVNSNLASKYMQQLPMEKRPIAGSEAAKLRKKQLEQQIPIYDMDENQMSNNLHKDQLKTFKAYMDMVRTQVVGQGCIQELVDPVVPSYAQPLQASAYSESSVPNIINPIQENVFHPIPQAVGTFHSQQKNTVPLLQQQDTGVVHPQQQNSGVLHPQPQNASALRSQHDTRALHPQLSNTGVLGSPHQSSAFSKPLQTHSQRIDSQKVHSMTHPDMAKNLNYLPDNQGRFDTRNARDDFMGSLIGTSTPNLSFQETENLRNNNDQDHLSSLTGSMNRMNIIDPTKNSYNRSEEALIPDQISNTSYEGSLPSSIRANLSQDSSYPGSEYMPQNISSAEEPIYANINPTQSQTYNESSVPYMPGGYLNNPAQNLSLSLSDQSANVDPFRSDSASRGYPNTQGGLPNMVPYGMSVPSSIEAVQAPYTAQMDKMTEHSFNADTMPVNVQLPSESSVLYAKNMTSQQECAKSSFMCQYCTLSMDPGDVAVICERAGPGKYWHPACFVCVTCKELLADLIYFYKDNKIYCGRHFADVVEIPRCKACDELIFGNSWTRADGFDWHIEHYCCFMCDTKLAAQKYVPDKNGYPYCMSCYMTCLARMCETCEEKIGPEDKRCGHRGYSFHATDQCFSCHTCRTALIGRKFKMCKNWLFCSQDCANMAADDIARNPNPKEKEEFQYSRC